MCPYTCYNKLLELLLSDGSAGDYEIIHGDKNELRIAGRAVREICGKDTAVINVGKSVLVVPFVFVDEETGELFVKYIEALKRARALNLLVTAVLDDCDRQLVAYISALREALNIVTSQTAFSIATYATLLVTYAELTQTYGHAEKSEDKYFEYQLAFEKTVHYLNLLVKHLPTIRDVEILLDAVRKSLRSSVDTKDTFNRVIGKVLGFQLESTEIYLIKDELGTCPLNVLVVAKRFQKRTEAEGRQAYILVPKQVKSFLKDTLPEEIFVGI